jgi:hypothetical protein
MKKVFSLRNSNAFVKGEFFVTYSAVRNGKKYITVHLNPCGNMKNDYCVTADYLNDEWNKKYKGLCPFNGDTDFEVLKLQQRF